MTFYATISLIENLVGFLILLVTYDFMLHTSSHCIIHTAIYL
jgi:hypothetical protein